MAMLRATRLVLMTIYKNAYEQRLDPLGIVAAQQYLSSTYLAKWSTLTERPRSHHALKSTRTSHVVTEVRRSLTNYR